MSILVTLYRLDTGRTHKIHIPPYMVLRCRTVERLHEGLGFHGAHMSEWNRPGIEAACAFGASPFDVELGVDTPQLFVLAGELMAIEPDDEVRPAEVSPGSIAVKIRPALIDEIRLLTRLIAEQILAGAPETDAARHVIELLEGEA